MKKIFVFTTLAIFALIFSYCHSSKKATSVTKVVSRYYYETDIKTLIDEKCSPCHIPSKGGQKKAWDNYEAVKANIDSMLYRVQLNPGEKGFMPFKRDKLSDSAINVFKEWRDGGMPEK